MKFQVRDLGRLSYTEALEVQKETLEKVVNGESPSTLLLVEHNPVITLGANFHEDNLLLPIEGYAKKGIEVYRTDRGGDVTFHGPGQLVAYPIFSIAERGKDVHKWLRDMESAVILTLQSFGVEGGRNDVNTGVWVGSNKICAMGVKLRRWVSMHGLALNCNTNLGYFQLIVPCGIRGGYGVTTLTRELGREVTIDEAKPILIQRFQEVFGEETSV